MRLMISLIGLSQCISNNDEFIQIPKPVIRAIRSEGLLSAALSPNLFFYALVYIWVGSTLRHLSEPD